MKTTLFFCFYKIKRLKKQLFFFSSYSSKHVTTQFKCCFLSSRPCTTQILLASWTLILFSQTTLYSKCTFSAIRSLLLPDLHTVLVSNYKNYTTKLYFNGYVHPILEVWHWLSLRHCHRCFFILICINLAPKWWTAPSGSKYLQMSSKCNKTKFRCH